MKYQAVIDVGSHEISMSIAQLRQRKPPKLLERVQRTVPAGSDTYRDGFISEAVLRQIVETLSLFRLKVQEYPDCQILATATSAIREAQNRAFILDQIERASGIKVRILSNNEEVGYQLLALGECSESFREAIKKPSLVLGLAAGSIQLSIFEDSHLLTSQNLRMGSLRIRALLSELAIHSRDFNQLIREYVSGDLANYRKFEPRAAEVGNFIIHGSGAGLTHLRKLSGLPPTGECRLSRRDFSRVLAMLRSRSEQSLVMEEGISDENASLLLPMALLIDEVFDLCDLDEALLPDVSLENGLLMEAAQQLSGRRYLRDPREDLYSASVELARRYQTDRLHSEQVARISLELFDQTQRLHRLKEEDRVMLQIGSLLHNVGKYISMQDDDIFSYQIIKSAVIPGVSDRKLEFLANLIYYHNGNFTRKPNLQKYLHEEDRLDLMKLLALLSMANALDASHSQKIQKCRLNRDEDGSYVLNLYSSEDIMLEMWTLERHKALFQNVFGVSLQAKYREIKA